MTPHRRTPPLGPDGVENVPAQPEAYPVETPERERLRVMTELRAQRDGVAIDPTPPPDHEDFLAARAAGLRSMRRNLSQRRRRA